MSQTAAIITPLHIIYLAGVIIILLVMILRKDTPVICIAFLFLLGLIGLKSFAGAIQVVFRAILYAAIQFMEIIATIASVTALSKCLADLGSDSIIMRPVSRFMKRPDLTWWMIGFSMLLFSLFLWPSPSVALVGAILIPLAAKTGLPPLAAASAMNLFGHGVALSYDFVIQGAPSISAGAAEISTAAILTEGRPLFLTMSIITVTTAFFLNRKSILNTTPSFSTAAIEKKQCSASWAAITTAIIVPIAFLGDILLMLHLNLRGTDATSIVSGTAVLLMCVGSVLGFGRSSFEKITGYVTEGFLFAIRIFAPVIVIGAFFFLGGDGINSIMGEQYQSGIMNDWALWLANNAPMNKYMIAFIQLFIGGLTGLDGSGFSGLPLTGALANTFGNAAGISIPLLASLGQIAAVFVGGGTIVPWGLIPVAAICNVDPIELAKKNLLPVLIGFICTFLVACFLL